MKAFFRDHKDIVASVDFGSAGVQQIVYLATGSHRYEIRFKGPGGNSFNAFGRPSGLKGWNASFDGDGPEMRC